jgi:hypothetical protein
MRDCGSRTTIGALERLADLDRLRAAPRATALSAALRDMAIRTFMLSNQLPLLEGGQKSRGVVDRMGESCGPSTPRAAERFFVEKHIDARPCPVVSQRLHQHRLGGPDLRSRGRCQPARRAHQLRRQRRASRGPPVVAPRAGAA